MPNNSKGASSKNTISAEHQRLAEADARTKHWKRWGPYLAERAWGNPREDYSADGSAWEYFPHDHARSRTYRWTEDGMLGICDNHQFLCFALTLWNGKDAILKERLFGLTGDQGNHGEDVKEIYYYLDATPTASYLKGLYKYPQSLYPYGRIVEETRTRSRHDPEYELQDTGAFDGSRYFDVQVEYAKQDVDDILIRIEATNRGNEPATLVLMPTLWFRNIWSWGPTEEPPQKPCLRRDSSTSLLADHPTLGIFRLTLEGKPELLFTENETNTERLWGLAGRNRFYKDAFHEYVIAGRTEAVNPQQQGTKACAVYRLSLSAGESQTLRFRLSRAGLPDLPYGQWDSVFAARIAEADEFYARVDRGLSDQLRQVQRQAFAGMFWSKQFYHFVIETWLNGDPTMPPPPESRKQGRDHTWRHLFNEDVISMPDKWEYPWYAAWDLAFHTVAIAPADPDFSKSQLSLFLREWYMHPNGQLPAYEWCFSDVNPPVHAWAAWRVFQIDRRMKNKDDLAFLERTFHKLLMNFTWWVNRKDSEGANIFEGGFLGLDNIGIFDRSAVLPTGWLLEQSDGSSWMAMYCLNMLKIALQLSEINKTYEDIASKFLEHFLYIADAINHYRGSGLWDEEDGFYYDRLRIAEGNFHMLRVRSLVGIVPLFACDTLDRYIVEKHPGFKKRMEWFIEHRSDLTEGLASMTETGIENRRLLSVVNRKRLTRILQRLFDENEFLSPYGIRSLSRYHRDHPYILPVDGTTFRIDYEPGESHSGMFGGNSNWRGPVWFPMNFLIIEALQRLNHYYGDLLTVEFPTGSGNRVKLGEAADQLACRLCQLFLTDKNGKKPVFGDSKLFQDDPHFKDHMLFYEYFHGDTGAGLGASHQTGWTGLVAKLIQQSGKLLCK
ncbi:MAG TPA: glucosidase [Bryobacteraceae bacterium]|nr:glucosidase [Bryobacteraceae bacterium]